MRINAKNTHLFPAFSNKTREIGFTLIAGSDPAPYPGV